MICFLRTLAVALLANKKEQADSCVLAAQTLGSRDLRCDDAFGVARTATVNVLSILRRSEKRRHGVHVRREDQIGSAVCGGVHIVSISFNRHLFRAVA